MTEQCPDRVTRHAGQAQKLSIVRHEGGGLEDRLPLGKDWDTPGRRMTDTERVCIVIVIVVGTNVIVVAVLSCLCAAQMLKSRFEKADRKL